MIVTFSVIGSVLAVWAIIVRLDRPYPQDEETIPYWEKPQYVPYDRRQTSIWEITP